MSQVLSIITGSGDPREARDRFLSLWESAGGSFSSAEYGHDLLLPSGERAVISIDGDELIFQGACGDRELEIMKTLADSLGTELLLDGEAIADNGGLPRWSALGMPGKFLAVVVALLFLPIGMVLLPVLVLIAVVRLGITLITGGRKHGAA